ncbi:MAG TPA: sulfatase-like hydrolase/transferase [Bacteroidales bacterium]|nr:sulfatase-like hydrolase/transferase [Bacteroidales bacterium]
MKKINIFIFCFISLFSVCQEKALCQPLMERTLQAMDKPNILFIVSEDNGPELGCYGAPVKTPHLDKFAKEGVLFMNAYVPQSGCSQSRAAFLTGLYPHQNGQIGLATWKYHMYNPVTPNIVKSLQEVGYVTGNIGKVHVNPESAFPFDLIAIHSSNFARKDMEQYSIQAEEFMSKSDKPFYLQVNYPDAHRPFLRQNCLTGKNKLMIL